MRFDKSYFAKRLTKDQLAELERQAAAPFQNTKDLTYRFSRKPNGDKYQLMGSDKKGVIMPFEYYSSNVTNGYMTGNPPAITVKRRPERIKSDGTVVPAMSDDEHNEVTSIVESIELYNDLPEDFKTTNFNLVTKCRGGYGLFENSENQIEVVSSDPGDTIAILDYNIKPQLIATYRQYPRATRLIS